MYKILKSVNLAKLLSLTAIKITPIHKIYRMKKSIDYTNTSKDNLEKQIQKAIEQLTKNLSYLNTHLSITLDKKADSLVIKIIDNKTNQVIKEIPPEYMLRIAEAINNLVGIIVNKKV